MQGKSKLINFIYFHRRRIGVASAFTATYSFMCYQSMYAKNEVLRLGVAGSLANVLVECGFHFVDTVNVRTKVSDTNDTSLKIMRKIYTKEGIIGFSRGFSACFYGSIACGFIYFSLYKIFKSYFRDMFGPNTNVAWVFFAASFVAEFFTLLVYYPFDLIKCRLQSKNYIFKYRNLPHAFRKELSEGSIMSLYRGSLPFLVTYCLFVSFQFTIYEYLVKFSKNYFGDRYESKQFLVNQYSSLLAGSIAAGCTNAFEVLTLNKQTNPDIKIWDIIKKEKQRLLTKGLFSRVAYNTMQSVVFFNLVHYIGLMFDVELTDD